VAKQQRKKEHELSLKSTVGIRLLTAPWGSQAQVGHVLTVTTRTLRTWKKQAREKQSPAKRGRKKAQAKFSEIMSIAREWRRQGKPGSRPVINKLKGLRVRLIREVVAGLKEKTKRRYQRHVLANRTSVEVSKPGVFTVMDAAKIPNQDGGECIVLRDRGSLRTEIETSEKDATCAADTLRVLNALKEQDRLPLVIGTDNGSPFVAASVAACLQENKVVHLRSLPRVPQHNGAGENAVGDAKRLLRDGESATQACRILNDCRKRATLNWKTPSELERENFLPVTHEERELFYNAANLAIQQAVLGTKNAYEKRKAEREAIFQTLESFSLITRTRGRRLA